jgi:hypothetical protein
MNFTSKWCGFEIIFWKTFLKRKRKEDYMIIMSIITRNAIKTTVQNVFFWTDRFKKRLLSLSYVHIGGYWYLENRVEIVWIIGSVRWFDKKYNRVNMDECLINDCDAGHFNGNRQSIRKQMKKWISQWTRRFKCVIIPNDTYFCWKIRLLYFTMFFSKINIYGIAVIPLSIDKKVKHSNIFFVYCMYNLNIVIFQCN